MGATERASLLPYGSGSVQGPCGGLEDGQTYQPIQPAIKVINQRAEVEGKQFRFSECFRVNKKVLIVAFIGMSLFAAFAIAFGVFMGERKNHAQNPPHPKPTPAPVPMPKNTTQLCEEMPFALAEQYQWFTSTALPPIRASIINVWKMFCAGQRIEDLALINQGAALVSTLQTTYANLSTQMVTGAYYYFWTISTWFRNPL